MAPELMPKKKYAVRKMGKSHGNGLFLRQHKKQDSIHNNAFPGPGVVSDEPLNSSPSQVTD